MNKVVSGMSSAQNPHGGQEATIKSLYTSMMHWGAIIVSPGLYRCFEFLKLVEILMEPQLLKVKMVKWSKT